MPRRSVIGSLQEPPLGTREYLVLRGIRRSWNPKRRQPSAPASKHDAGAGMKEVIHGV